MGPMADQKGGGRVYFVGPQNKKQVFFTRGAEFFGGLNKKKKKHPLFFKQFFNRSFKVTKCFLLCLWGAGSSKFLAVL